MMQYLSACIRALRKKVAKRKRRCTDETQDIYCADEKEGHEQRKALFQLLTFLVFIVS